MRYGLPYQGSKNAIAKWVIDHLPPAQTLVDAFAGGCAITHAALLSGKYEKIIANDINGAPQLFIDAINGEFDNYSYVPTKEEFHKRKEQDLAVALLYGFGNNGKTYLWGEDLEPVKVAASKMICAPSLHERRMYYKDFIEELAKYNSFEDEGESLKQLQGVQRLERIQNLKLSNQNLIISNKDYRDLDIHENSIIYCDIPYRGTDCRLYKGFDNDAFDEWINKQKNMVIVSEYVAPRGCVCVAETEKLGFCNEYGTTKSSERLFVQERFVETYNQAMKQGTLLEYMED